MKLCGLDRAMVSWIYGLMWICFVFPGHWAMSSHIQIADGFEVTQVYSVPRESQGSWVALCLDHKGRLIAGDQEGGLYRISLKNGQVESVEALGVDVGFVNGLTYAFDSLYAVVAEDEYQGGGLYRLRDLDGDDDFDEVKYLRDFVAKGEHGPHSVVPGPEGRWLYVISGNKTPIPYGDGFKSLVPEHWREDDLLPRLWGPIGSEKGTTAPGGWIARTDQDGKSWELMAIGFRNAFDIAFNEAGDLFTVDADAEFDMGTSWYQPTRLLHVVPGTDYGWRSGSGKWPPHFSDTVPPIYEYGPGSPTGVTFGYGTRFPEKYQKAIFACDWSWGRVFVTWMSPKGASYSGETEEFLTGIPLPIADLIVNPFDGAMYFVLGGRGTTSGLYRIDYVGPSGRSKTGTLTDEEADGEDSMDLWFQLASEDRVVRHRARIELERSKLDTWKERALAEENPVARLTAILALARAGEPELLPRILNSITELDWSDFSLEEELLALRCLELAFIRMGSQDTSTEGILKLLESRFPADGFVKNAELLKLLVYLGSEFATPPAVELLERAVTQEDELRILLPLRVQTKGWTPELRQRFMVKLGMAHGWSGGRSMVEYVKMMEADALQSIPMEDREYFETMIIDSRPVVGHGQVTSRKFVKDWTSEDFNGVGPDDLKNRDALNGRGLFEAAGCFACHRVNGEGGGLAPDLSAVMRRFSIQDLMESILEPSKVISDQYGTTLIQKTDGTQLHGRVVNYFGDAIGFQTDSLDAANVLRIPKTEITAMVPSPISSMPPGLLNTFSRDEIVDLLAWLYSSN